MTVTGVVLAAGAGRRFGGAKALVPFGGKLLVERAVLTLAQAGCTRVLVVVGARADEVIATADLQGADVVINPLWDEGLSTSLRAGLAHAGDASAVVLVLVDQPGIVPASVVRLKAAWQAGATAAAATYGGMPGHPVLLDRRIWGEVAASASGDSGAREWLRAHPEEVELVDCTGVGDPSDLDTREDLERWLRQA